LGKLRGAAELYQQRVVLERGAAAIVASDGAFEKTRSNLGLTAENHEHPVEILWLGVGVRQRGDFDLVRDSLHVRRRLGLEAGFEEIAVVVGVGGEVLQVVPRFRKLAFAQQVVHRKVSEPLRPCVKPEKILSPVCLAQLHEHLAT